MGVSWEDGQVLAFHLLKLCTIHSELSPTMDREHCLIGALETLAELEEMDPTNEAVKGASEKVAAYLYNKDLPHFTDEFLRRHGMTREQSLEYGELLKGMKTPPPIRFIKEAEQEITRLEEAYHGPEERRYRQLQR